MAQFRARIRPAAKAERYNLAGKLFAKSKGWYAVDADTARKLEPISSNVLNPQNGSPVFEVCTEEEARAIERFETIKIDPRGTASDPI